MPEPVAAARRHRQALDLEIGRDAIEVPDRGLGRVVGAEHEPALRVAAAVVDARRGQLGFDGNDLADGAAVEVEHGDTGGQAEQQEAGVTAQREAAEALGERPLPRRAVGLVPAAQRRAFDVGPVERGATIAPQYAFTEGGAGVDEQLGVHGADSQRRGDPGTMPASARPPRCNFLQLKVHFTHIVRRWP